MSKASDYRKMAADCQEIAARMSLTSDRARMTAMAERWLRQAQCAEAEESVRRDGLQALAAAACT
jgi:hypothetical protein